jgi:Tripartite tricarboxylate transporter TctB family
VLPKKVTSPEDFYAGLMFIAVGVTAIYLSKDYPMGSALRMGPGYFPTWLGGIMSVFGLVVFATSFKVKGTGTGDWALRPLFVLSGSIVMFGLSLDYLELGFVPALIMLILGCALAHKDVHWLETILLSIFLTMGCVGLFIYVIGLPYRLFWWSY